MKLPVFIFDPTLEDSASKVRGIGRYVQVLKSTIPDARFVGDIQQVPYESILIFPFFNFLGKPLAYRKIARKQIAVIHDLIPFKYPKHFPYGFKGLITSYINIFTLRNYDIVVTDSQSSKNDIVDMIRFKQDNVHIIYPPVTSALKHIAPPAKTQKLPPQPYCIYVGDATWNKNLINIARAIKIANIDCVFIGKNFINSKMNMALVNKHRAPNPWLDELYGFYEEVHGDSRFHLYGFVSDEFLIELYKGAMCNLLVSRDEGFGFSFAEAGSLGTPSVLADTPIFHETAQDTALYANPEDPLEIADKIQTMRTDQRSELSKKVQERVEVFSEASFSKEFTKLISILQQS